MPWYFEELQLGNWSPKVWDYKPKTVTMGISQVLARSESTGGPIRRLKEITPEQAAKGLDYLKSAADVDAGFAEDAALEREDRRVAASP